MLECYEVIKAVIKLESVRFQIGNFHKLSLLKIVQSKLIRARVQGTILLS